jgi:dienelactone hydrolase
MDEHHITIPRTARYYTLGPERGATALWIVCHGYGQLARFLLRHFEPLDDGTRRIVAPEALSRFYLENPGGDHRSARVGATWMTRDDREVEIADYVRYLDLIHAEAVAGGVSVAAPLTVLGFSQGVATVCRWVARGTVKVQRLVLWAERLPPDLDLAQAGAVLRELDLVLVAGDQDPAGAADRVAEDGARLDAAGIPYRRITFPGGHHLDAGVLRSLT